MTVHPIYGPPLVINYHNISAKPIYILFIMLIHVCPFEFHALDLRKLFYPVVQISILSLTYKTLQLENTKYITEILQTYSFYSIYGICCQ